MDNKITPYKGKQYSSNIDYIDEEVILESKYKTKLSKGSKRKTPKTK